MRRTTGKGILTVCGALLATAAGAASEAPLSTYTATYDASARGFHGSTEFKLSYDARNGAYTFTNSTQVRGLIKLARPKPAVDRSRFQYEDGRIVPLEFWYEDGSRRGEGNRHAVFDWSKRTAVVTSKDGKRNIPLTAGVLDTGSVQVALMTALQAGKTPGPYRLLDGDSISTYTYTVQGREKVDTPYGKIEATRVEQRSPGSSRVTYIWAASSLKFLPVKIEQQRNSNGDVLSSFVLRSVEGLSAAK